MNGNTHTRKLTSAHTAHVASATLHTAAPAATYLLDRVEDRESEMSGATFAWGHTADHVGAVLNGIRAV